MRLLISILCLLLVFFTGMIVADEIIPREKPTLVHVAVSPRIREVVKVEKVMVPHEVVVMVPYERTVEVERIIEVEVVREEHIIPADWESLEELDAFWADHYVMVTLIAGKDGKNQIEGQCVAYAAAHRDAAAAIGKALSIYCLEPREYNRLFCRTRMEEDHAVNMALVDYELWLIEPATGERVLWGIVP